jgi:hypothetical protein
MLGGCFLVAAAVFTGTALAAGETLTNLTDLTDLLAKLPSCSVRTSASFFPGQTDGGRLIAGLFSVRARVEWAGYQQHHRVVY